VSFVVTAHRSRFSAMGAAVAPMRDGSGLRTFATRAMAQAWADELNATRITREVFYTVEPAALWPPPHHGQSGHVK
jgi:hypothetical protein